MKTRLAKKIVKPKHRTSLERLKRAVIFLNKRAYKKLKHKLTPDAVIESLDLHGNYRGNLIKVYRDKLNRPMGLDLKIDNGMLCLPIFRAQIVGDE